MRLRSSLIRIYSIVEVTRILHSCAIYHFGVTLISVDYINHADLHGWRGFTKLISGFGGNSVSYHSEWRNNYYHQHCYCSESFSPSNTSCHRLLFVDIVNNRTNCWLWLIISAVSFTGEGSMNDLESPFWHHPRHQQNQLTNGNSLQLDFVPVAWRKRGSFVDVELTDDEPRSE